MVTDSLPPIAIILRGGPAVGKTAIGRALRDRLPNSICISVDDIVKMIGDFSPFAKKWAHIGARKLTEVYVEQGWHVIFEELFDVEVSLRNTTEWAAQHGLHCFVFHLSADSTDVRIRNLAPNRDVLEDKQLTFLTNMVNQSIPQDAIPLTTSGVSVAECVDKILAHIVSCLHTST